MMQSYKQKIEEKKFNPFFLLSAYFFYINDKFYHILQHFFYFQKRLLKKN